MQNRVLYIICFLLCSLDVACRVITVCNQCDFQSVSSAIDEANNGDEILIKPGTYFEDGIVIDKSIHIRGEVGAIIDAQEKGEVVTLIADGVTIEGVTIKNVGKSYTEDRAGIRIKGCKNFLVKNNTLINTFFGIYIEHAHNGEIADNTIRGEAIEEMSSGNAIHAWYCKNLIISKNSVFRHRDGIYFEFVDDSKIFENRSEENLRYGLHFMFSNRDDYYKNTFQNNGAGVAVMFSKKINMHENVFSHNWGKSSYGLLLKEIYDAEILDNQFVENTIGIYVEGSTRINYIRNNFLQNGWAIKISGGCVDNVILSNNFIANTFDLSAQNNSNNNLFDGNYWSSYSGYDLDKDGVGDVPYHPVKLFNYIVEQTPESMVLLRSFFIDLLNFSEKVSPIFTPKKILDNRPLMNQITI